MQNVKIHTGRILNIYAASVEMELELPYIENGISAGFPSPAMDFVEISIDLNKHLIRHPSATFYGRVKGYSLKNAGIDDGDLLIIDKSIEPSNGKIVICFLDGEFTAKRIKMSKNEIWLLPENENYKPIKVEKDNELIIWGVVLHVIKSF